MWRDFESSFGRWGLTATRGGGSARPFAISDQSLTFGALTLEGAGGVKPAFTGTPAGDFAISGGQSANYSVDSSGYITPSSNGSATDGDTFTYGDGTTSATITIAAAANVYSVRPDNAEIEAAWEDAATDSNATIKVRDGSNAVDAGPVSLAAKAAASEITIIPYNYAAAAGNVAGTGISDARQTTRPVTLRGMISEGVIDNLTVRGFIFRRDLDTESETNGIVEFHKGSDNITIHDNEIGLLTPFTARDHVSDGYSGKMRGIATPLGTGASDGWTILGNYIHDVSLGVSLLNQTDCEVSENLIFDVYGSFTALGGTSTSGVSYLDNIFHNVWANAGDAGVPHASIGLSFDPGPQNVTIQGNIVHVGRHRFDHDGEYPSATGVKFNDPDSSTSYQTIEVGYNLLVVSANIALELSGMTGADVYQNTIVGTPDHNIGQNDAGLFLSDTYASSTIRIWNNIVQGEADQGDAWSGSEISGEYGNYRVLTQGTAGPAGHVAVFTGNATKGFFGLTIEEIIAAYAPKPGHYVETEALGAIGTGDYTFGDGGAAAPTFAAPAPTGGTAAALDQTVWDGSNDYAQIASGGMGASGGNVGVFAFEMANVEPTGNKTLFSAQFNDVVLSLVGTTFRFFVKNAAHENILYGEAYNVIPDTASEDKIRLALSYDLSAGRALVAVNGAPVTLINLTTMTADTVYDGGSLWRIGANQAAGEKFAGYFSMAYYDNRFVDLWTVSGLNELFDSTGGFRTFADTGLLYYYGDKAALEGGAVNNGSGTGFNLTGSVEDVATTTFFDDFTTDTSSNYNSVSGSASITYDDANDQLDVVQAASFDGIITEAITVENGVAYNVTVNFTNPNVGAYGDFCIGTTSGGEQLFNGANLFAPTSTSEQTREVTASGTTMYVKVRMRGGGSLPFSVNSILVEPAS